MEYRHVPVMLKEVIEYLDPKPGGRFVDCTLGGGGYTLSLRERIGETGSIIAIDLDPLAIANTEAKIKKNQYQNLRLVNDNFKNLQKIIDQTCSNIEEALFDGIVLDLGLSGAQLEDRNRGFSFGADTSLDMEFGIDNQEYWINRTKDILNKWREEEIARIIWEYGEERFSRRIAKSIVETRKAQPLTTTGQLVEIIKRAIPKRLQSKKVHPATKTFQALRIATNRELENLELVLPQALSVLKPGGRLAVVTFHSLEDRIVKNFFKQESKDCLCPPEEFVCRCGHQAVIKIITKKALPPSAEEVAANPKSRSAKLRVAEKV